MIANPPNTSPPSFTPLKSQSQILQITGLGIDDTLLRSCLFKKIYIWFRDNIEFWVWLTFIGGGHAVGWRWNGSYWIYFEIDLRKVESFICYH